MPFSSIGVSAGLAEYSVPNIRLILAEYSAEYSVFGRTLVTYVCISILSCKYITFQMRTLHLLLDCTITIQIPVPTILTKTMTNSMKLKVLLDTLKANGYGLGFLKVKNVFWDPFT